MKIEKPAKGISKLFENKDSVCYRIDCDCTSNNHAVDTWIEVERLFNDCEDISVRFYVSTYTHPFARGFWQRLKNAGKVLLGIDEQQHEIILNEQTAFNWCKAVESAVTKLDNKVKTNDN